MTHTQIQYKHALISNWKKKEINQKKFTSQGEENKYTRNEILNTIKEKSNLKQQINHRKSWEETSYSREIRNQSGINIGTAIHFLFFIY